MISSIVIGAHLLVLRLAVMFASTLDSGSDHGGHFRAIAASLHGNHCD
jgi:hypothetical protein